MHRYTYTRRKKNVREYTHRNSGLYRGCAARSGGFVASLGVVRQSGRGLLSVNLATNQTPAQIQPRVETLDVCLCRPTRLAVVCSRLPRGRKIFAGVSRTFGWRFFGRRSPRSLRGWAAVSCQLSQSETSPGFEEKTPSRIHVL